MRTGQEDSPHLHHLCTLGTFLFLGIEPHLLRKWGSYLSEKRDIKSPFVIFTPEAESSSPQFNNQMFIQLYDVI